MNGFTNKTEIFHWAKLLSINPPHRFNRKMAGQAPASVPGDGFDFRDVREYYPGDDARHIAWSATARRGEPFVKTFHEDRTQEVWIVIDISPQIGFASVAPHKYDVITSIGALLFTSFGLMERGSNLLFFQAETNKVDHVRLRPGRRNILAGFNELSWRRPTMENTVSQGQESLVTSHQGLDHLFRSLLAYVRRPSVIFILSDFWHAIPWTLWQTVDSRHALYPIRITDPFEELIFERPDAAAFLHFSDGLQGLFPQTRAQGREVTDFITSRPRCFNRLSTGFAFADFVAFLQERNR